MRVAVVKDGFLDFCVTVLQHLDHKGKEMRENIVIERVLFGVCDECKEHLCGLALIHDVLLFFLLIRCGLVINDRLENLQKTD